MVKTKIALCGVMIDNKGFDEAIQMVDKFIVTGQITYILTPNIDHIIKLQKDAEFRHIYEQAALVLPDGMPLLWAAKFLQTPLKEKISGSDFAPKMFELAAKKSYKLLSNSIFPKFICPLNSLLDLAAKSFKNFVLSSTAIKFGWLFAL